MIPRELQDKVPPHDTEAEQAALGSVLLDPDTISELVHVLKPEDFYNNNHKAIFSAMLSLYEKGQKIDLITLVDEMRSLDSLNTIGGPAYLAKLSEIVPSSANITNYALIVLEHAKRRGVIKLASKLTQQAHDLSNEINQLMDQVEEEMFALTHNREELGYRSMNDIVPRAMNTIMEIAKNPHHYEGIMSGFEDLDNLLNGFQKSSFVVIGARPNVGKTAFGLNIATHVALRLKVPAAFFSLEMPDLELMYRILASESRITSERFKKGMYKNKEEIIKLTEVASRIYEAPLHIIDRPGLKLLELRSLARRLKAEKNVGIIFIDYLGLLVHENNSLQRWEQFSDISRSLKALARELNIPVVALAQLRREAEGKNLPTLADLRDSGSIEQDADLILFLHREREIEKDIKDQNDYIPTDLYIAKNRNGQTGKITLMFFKSITRFETLEKSH